MNEALQLFGVFAAVAGAFFVSASAGLGGSLILVPALSLALGAKEGVALAALLLAANNIVKVTLYRRTMPLRASAVLAACTVAGAYVGSRLLVEASEQLVTVAVIVSFVVALGVELASTDRGRLVSIGSRRASEEPGRQGVTGRALAPVLALASGATSGFSGTSGPLKGVAVRRLGFDRIHTVGAAAIVSTFGDLTKTAVFSDAGLLDADSFRIMLVVVPLMLGASMAGRWFNAVGGERVYALLFWLVMVGYTGRLIVA